MSLFYTTLKVYTNFETVSDKTEYVVTPNVQPESEYNAEDIRSRYIINSVTDSKTEND